ncbi:MAG: cobalamin transport system substrate-binding protein [Chloroflexota bacterium]|jgi:iron complex transport system substrate-binding protein|nr:cobalamin transport system substrate-binding protein [Chloroflexota bacterium]
MRPSISVQTPSSIRLKGSIHARLTAGVAALLVFLAGCGATGGSSPSPTPAPVSTPATTAPATSTATATVAPTVTPVVMATPALTATPEPAAAFPMTVTDDEGTAVEIAQQPERIVSLAPSNTEIVFALGAGERLVAGTDADDYPAEAAALPDAVLQTKVLKEQIAALRPDLILAYGNGFTPPADVTQLRALGYPVLVVYASSLVTAEKDITLIGTALGAPTEAAAILEEVHAQFDAIEAVVPATAPRPRTFYEVGYGPGIYTPSADSAYAEMITLAGGDPITTDASFTISLEALVEADPEVILLGDAAYGVCPDQVAGRDGWQTMTAVKDDAIRPAFDTVVTRPGPRLPLGLASLVRGIHPEVTLPAGIPPDPVLCAAP